MAKQELFESKQWGWWFRMTNCISISKDGKDCRAVKDAVKKLKEGRCLVVFPEGSRSDSGELKAPELGIGFLAVKSKAPVIPIFISGTEKVLPVKGRYRIGVPVKAYIGKAVDFKGVDEIHDKKEKYRFVSERIMQAIAKLKRENKP